MRYEEIIKPGVSERGLNRGKPLFEMSNLAPEETGLPFTVFVSPRGGAPHGPRVKVTIPPWGAHPEGVYSIEPVECIAGVDWLSAHQKGLLQAWIGLNKLLIEDFWEGRIHYDRELRAKLLPIGDAPPGNSLQAVATFRAITPKVQSIRWHEGSYVLTFNRYTPSAEKVRSRFSELGYEQQVAVGTVAPAEGIVLWQASNTRATEQ